MIYRKFFERFWDIWDVLRSLFIVASFFLLFKALIEAPPPIQIHRKLISYPSLRNATNATINWKGKSNTSNDVIPDYTASSSDYKEKIVRIAIPMYTAGDKCFCDSETHILIYFQSFWGHLLKRRRIRSTWASASLAHNFPWKLKFVFILGQPMDINDRIQIKNEQMLYGDIIVGDFIDSYRNLSLKSVILMHFVDTKCNTVKYVIKVDDDIFINLYSVTQKVLPLMKSEENVLACHVIENGTSPIVRDEKSKWYLPPDVFGNSTYLPRFCSGYVVIMTSKLVRNLYEKAKVTDLIFVDDVYMFGKLAEEVANVVFIDIKKNLTLSADRGLKEYRMNKWDLVGVGVGDSMAAQELWRLTLMYNVRSREAT